MTSWTTASPEETRAVGRELGRELAPDGLLLLDGDLGAGKTVLTQGVAEGLGLDPDEVQSPTFVLVREHGGIDEGEGEGEGEDPRLVHVDLYRLEPEEVDGVGLDELLAGPGVKVIEWAERLPWDAAEIVPGRVIAVTLERLEGDGSRRRITARVPGRALGSRPPIA